MDAEQIRQDWLDRLLGRQNVILDRISHSQGRKDPMAAHSRRILVPSVRTREIAIVIDEILPGCRLEALAFTPIHIRYFKKHALILSLFYVIGLVVANVLPAAMSWLILLLAVLWPLHLLLLFLRFKRGGLAVDDGVVVARSGAIGIDYRLFAAEKIQDATHIQSLLMRRHDLSSLKVHTASTTIRVPYMPTAFMRKVVDYCTYRAESTARSWM
jgi:putative membrane protein